MSGDGKGDDDAHEQLKEQLRRLEELSAKVRTTAAAKQSKLRPAPIALIRSAEEVLAEAVKETSTPGYWPSVAENANTWAGEATAAKFWKDAGREVASWSNEYHLATRSRLLAHSGLPAFEGKGNPRLKEKVLAEVSAGNLRDVFPEGGGPVPLLKDLVRVRLSTAYLDGVAFLKERLIAQLEKSDIKVEEKTQARAKGYYASHLTFSYPLLFRFTSVVQAPVGCEIQIGTELATTIWDRTHPAYEIARVTADGDGWQWDPNDPRFIAGQLAHMIHLADGLIVQLRDAVDKQKAKGVK